MKAIVVYESLWGNTEQVARSVAAGLTRHLDVTVLTVADAPDAISDDIALTVVGVPTHAFSLSRPQTRHEAFTRLGRPSRRRRGIAGQGPQAADDS